MAASVPRTVMLGALGFGELLAASDPASNSQPDSYRRTDYFPKLPVGRIIQSSGAVAVHHAGHKWIAELPTRIRNIKSLPAVRASLPTHGTIYLAQVQPRDITKSMKQ
jgi:hypothetical protein